MTSDLSREILDYLKRIDESINGPRPQEWAPEGRRPLSDRVSDIQFGLATLAANTKGEFDRVDKRFDQVECHIESTRVEIVDLVTRVHSELTGRVIDLEVPGPGEKGSGGRGSGGSGVPLAS